MRHSLRLLWLLAAIALFIAAFPVLADQAPPLSLPETVRFAFKNNTTIRNACDVIVGARYGVDVAEAEFGFRFTPQASSGLGADTETSQSTTLNLSKKFSTGTALELSSGTSSSDKNFHRSFTGVTISQSLLRGFGPFANTQNLIDAKRRIGSAERQAELTKEQVALEVIATFYRIVAQKLVLSIWGKSLERAQHLLVASEAKTERGLATKIDIFRSQSQVAAMEGNVFEAQEALQETKDALKFLLNRDMHEEIDVEPQLLPLEKLPNEQELIDEAVHRRFDLQEATEQVKDAERSAQMAARNLLPDIRVGVNYSLTGRGANFSDSLGFDTSRFRLLLSSSIPLDFAAERAQYAQKQIELARKKREGEDLRKKVVQDIRQASRHLATLQKRLEVQEKNLQASQAGLDLARFRFERGYADLAEVLRAEDAITQAQKEEVALRTDSILASLQLRKASGILGFFLDSLLGDSSSPTACLTSDTPAPAAE